MTPVLLLLAACVGLKGMDPEQPCLEAGYAIASQTFTCDGDADAANARFEDFRDTFACVPHPLEDEGSVKLNPQADLFHCALTIRSLSCDTVADFGDDLSLWMSVSPACPLIATYADGSALPGYDPGLNGTSDDTIPCSEQLGDPVSVTITNRAAADLFLYWRDGGCVETLYGTIAGYGALTQPTTEGHVWAVRTRDGTLITWFTASPGLSVVVP